MKVYLSNILFPLFIAVRVMPYIEHCRLDYFMLYTAFNYVIISDVCGVLDLLCNLTLHGVL